MSLRHDIRRLGFVKYLIGDDITLEAATRAAGRELGLARKARQPERPKTKARSSGGGLRGELMRKLFDGLGRLRERPQPRPQLVPHVLDRDYVAASPVVVKAEQTEPQPPADQIIGVYTGGTTGAELLDQGEFPPRYFDLTTANWRKSLVDGERRAEQRRRGGQWIG
jgi:hypothetical protein